MKHNFKIGDKVGELYEEFSSGFVEKYSYSRYESPPNYGEIIGFKGKNQCFVIWGTNYKNQDHFDNKACGLVKIKNIIPELEMQNYFSELHKEWTELQEAVKEKIDICAQNLDQARKLASKGGTSLKDMYESLSSLYDVMENIGWRTSSFNC